ncbi:MAG: response regulator [Myxococcaceae bacterium]
MNRILWIGLRHSPPELKSLLLERGIELITFRDAESALAATSGVPVAVAVVAVDLAQVPSVVEKLCASRPEIQVLVATDVGVPRQLALALWAGASGVLEFRTETRQEILHQIQEWISRHNQASRERELLLRLRGLNEDFLKNVVAAQKRNLELEEQLQPEAERLAVADGATRVLVVDDEDIVRQVLCTLLERKGYPFEAVADGEAAVALLREKPFHLVITDKNLPGLSGLDVLREAKAAGPETDVIMMTGYSSMDSAIQALNLGASAYLEKPFDDVKNVLAKIEGVVAKQRDRLRKRHYLHLIKDRNRDFLERYRVIRADLESWLQTRGVLPPQAPGDGAAQVVAAPPSPKTS